MFCNLTASESKQNQHVNKEELEDVQDHTSQGHLQWPKVRVDGEYVHKLQEREDHASCESTWRKIKINK
jgi:hypothetical protein